MPKFKVQLSMLQPMVANIIVEAPSQGGVEENLGDIYQDYEGDAWVTLVDVDEGTHVLLDDVPADTEKPDLVYDEDGALALDEGGYDPVGGGGGHGRSDLPYGQGGGGD